MYNSNTLNNYPLGIFCKCQNYQKIADNFKFTTLGTLSPLDRNRKVNKEPISSAKIHWVKKPIGDKLNFSQPVLEVTYNETIKPSRLEQKWIPVKSDLTSVKDIRPNTSFLNHGGYSTQSSQTSTLTDMLPHRGCVKKRKDINWVSGSHKTPVEMTNTSINFKYIRSCCSDWAQDFTLITGSPPY